MPVSDVSKVMSGNDLKSAQIAQIEADIEYKALERSVCIQL